MCFYHGRHEEYKDFFSKEDGVMFCNGVCPIMEVLGHECNPDQWCLFIDSSKVSLKVVLLHNGNKFPSIPLVHAATMKESYESVKLLLGKIKYGEFKWKLCDLKLWHCYSECNSVTQKLLFPVQVGWSHKILLFPVHEGQPGQEESLCNKLWPK